MRELAEESFEPFGSYLLLRPLGKGGMGVVYVARTSSDVHPLAALKRLRPDASNVPGFRERFWHEGAIALRLEHPNVVETLDVGEVDGQPFVAAALVFGKDLQKVAERLGKLDRHVPAPIMARILLDVLTGLAYLHGAREPDGRLLRLVHRDITPGNLLVGYDGKTRIADFGAAKSLLSEPLALTAEGMIIGTPRYMAPEVIRGQPAIPASDLYSLGAVAYRVLTRTAPYDGTPKEIIEQVLRHPPRPITALRPDLPKSFVTLVDQMLAHELAARPGSAKELMRTLQAEAARTGTLASHEEVSRFMAELFAEDRRREKDEHDAMRRVRRELVPNAREGTRVIAKTERLEASVDLPPTVNADRTADRTALAPTSAAKRTGPELVPEDTGFEDPAFEPKTAKAPAPKRTRWGKVIAGGMGAAVIAGILFQRVVLGPTEERRYHLVERLGTSRRELEALRAAGRALGPEADQLVDRVKKAALDGDLIRGELDLQELDLLLERGRHTSTATGAEPRR